MLRDGEIYFTPEEIQAIKMEVANRVRILVA
jgi:hypothetical protein